MSEPKLPEANEQSPPTNIWKLGVLFATIYAVQAMNEPFYGLLGQPLPAYLDHEQHFNSEQITTYMGLLSFPWTIKPLYGLLTDFVPIFGYRRRSYLILLASASAIAMFAVALVPTVLPNTELLFWLVMMPGLATAFCDVVIDAYMVESCQPLGLTGRMQSVQWTSLYATSTIAGLIGGYLSQNKEYRAAFFICGLASLAPIILGLFVVKEPRSQFNRADLLKTLRELGRAVISPAVWPAAIYLFLWHFNPYSRQVFRLQVIHALDLDESFFGTTRAVNYGACMLGSFAYGWYCRKLSLRRLANIAVLVGVLANLSYLGVTGKTSAIVASALEGLATGTASIMLLDVAAQLCPPKVAGTVFAVLMSFANLGMSFGIMLGGTFYENWTKSVGRVSAFNRLVLIAALFTSLTWVIVPFMIRHRPAQAEA